MYSDLKRVYQNALQQAEKGKGQSRHVNPNENVPYTKQPICEGGRRFGVGALLYQAWKKTHETPALLTMVNGKERALAEILGAMNYLAAAYLTIEAETNPIEKNKTKENNVKSDDEVDWTTVWSCVKHQHENETIEEYTNKNHKHVRMPFAVYIK